MTTGKQITLKCRCGAESAFTAHETVNVTDNPGLKQPLLGGRLWTHTCPSCGVEARVLFPLLYQDMNLPGGEPGASLMLMLSPDPAFDPAELDAGMSDLQFLSRMANQSTRVVRSHNELIEKIHIFEAGLDDRSVEVLKAMIRQQLPALSELELLFNGKAEDGSVEIIALTQEGPRGVLLPAEEYERVHAMIAPMFGALAFVRWGEVGRQFGDQVIGKAGQPGS